MTTHKDGLYQYGGVPVGWSTNVFGNTWFVSSVATLGNDENTGKSPKAPFLTIAQAISKGAAGDTIVLAPGTHSVDVSASALVPKADMQFVAAIPPMGGMPSTVITHDADDGVNLVTIDVDGVGFYGIKFLHVAGGTTALTCVTVSQTTAVNGLIFRDCWFDQNSVDVTGIVSLQVNDATNATTGMVVKNCRFLGADATTAALSVLINVGVGGIPDALIEDNVFILESIDASTNAIVFADPAAGGGSYAWVCRNNDFIGPVDYGADGVGITFTGAMTEGEILGIIRTNYFSYCGASPITVDEANQSIVNNYYGDVATGGVLVDPGT